MAGGELGTRVQRWFLPAVALGLAVLLGLTLVGPRRGRSEVILATTTSVDDSGLLDVVIPAFTAGSGIAVRVVAVGTGQALAYARRGDADVVLVHAPEAELEFVAQGHGVERRPVMYNEFVLVGPAADPAGVRGLKSLAGALERLAAAAAGGASGRAGGGPAPPVRFVSRGDRSGTHLAELDLWRAAGLDPAGFDRAWYLEVGAGMAETLTLASERGAYTLADTSTFVAWRSRLALEVLVAQEPPLKNPYHVIAVNPARHPRVNHAGALALIEFLTSERGRAIIREFGRERYGEPIFRLEAGGQVGPP